ncbi:hypothetical protein pipiens_008719 [Culex pipiens pipiens]|uniref:Uncharacterized protein n=1 Tax=Culex pipiens pipiens TaxID=38569 RepID=A0ABD1DH34_CULPP
MSPKTRVVFKFIFGLGIWSFLVLGFFKLNGDQVTPHQFQQTPINGRLLLNKDNRWTGNEATSTTTDRYASPVGAGVDEVLVDNRAGHYFFAQMIPRLTFKFYELFTFLVLTPLHVLFVT